MASIVEARPRTLPTAELVKPELRTPTHNPSSYVPSALQLRDHHRQTSKLHVSSKGATGPTPLYGVRPTESHLHPIQEELSGHGNNAAAQSSDTMPPEAGDPVGSTSIEPPPSTSTEKLKGIKKLAFWRKIKSESARKESPTPGMSQFQVPGQEDRSQATERQLPTQSMSNVSSPIDPHTPHELPASNLHPPHELPAVGPRPSCKFQVNSAEPSHEGSAGRPVQSGSISGNARYSLQANIGTCSKTDTLTAPTDISTS
ncbi:hypothetical protein K469DRAFT_753739 [Zopfia rhizophila CBS 207.26]|uniref:Uncharacterized protein n=1 Tax=Zopfia rhizophila CBS 207.26 TaxID=1314779 RepID=A0A6A6DK72_9PEZI|nr:hypothetical protein K469DRAFT_753739 [Zopfia rhizophila CBS 207.26]